ncbi:MAG: N-6 DNA methylase [Phycisphaerae bacterium]|nr:N-6 DNA methylase [Phycisphaerae bacterium]
MEYMTSRLVPRDEDRIWEPCAGDGDLVDGVLAVSPNATIRLSELDENAVHGLVSKYRETNIDIHHEDALEVGSNPLFDQGISFSRIVANPPYGAYQTPQRRRRLQAQFPKLYVRDTYGVILFHCLDLLDAGGRLVFIIPDTFLWLNRHEFLRRRIFKTTTIEELALFPSKFFPNVNFGYSGLCIISLTNSAPANDHEFQLLNNFQSVEALVSCVESCSDWKCNVSMFTQLEIASRKKCDLHIVNHAIALCDRATESLGDHAEIRTGFYSGNDVRWVRRKDGTVPRSKKFSNVDFNKVAVSNPTLDGISGEQHFIPIMRGGAFPYHKPTHWYVDWSREAVTEYRRKGKNPARFQNSSYYFRDGIGVPMVASTRLTGALLEKRLFDQGIVGVFPASPRLLYYILGFLNSSIATRLIRQINPTANNSANYMKRLPFVIPTAGELAFIDPLVERAIIQSCKGIQLDGRLTKQINSFYDSVWLDLTNAAEQTDEPEPE